jgi:hypothetical protein
LRHVAYSDAAGRRTSLTSGVRVSVQCEIEMKFIDRFTEEIRPEEGIDLRWFTVQGVADR